MSVSAFEIIFPKVLGASPLTVGCNEIRKQLPDFVSDMLAETIHEEVRLHLVSCVPCQSFALSFDSFASDLKRIALVDIPFDLAKSISAGLSKGAHPARVRPWS